MQDFHTVSRTQGTSDLNLRVVSYYRVYPELHPLSHRFSIISSP